MPRKPAYPPATPPRRKLSGENLRQARTNAGMSREALAVQIGRGVSTVYYFESGRQVPSADMAAHIADLLGSPLDALFEPIGDA